MFTNVVIPVVAVSFAFFIGVMSNANTTEAANTPTPSYIGPALSVNWNTYVPRRPLNGTLFWANKRHGTMLGRPSTMCVGYTRTMTEMATTSAYYKNTMGCQNFLWSINAGPATAILKQEIANARVSTPREFAKIARGDYDAQIRAGVRDMKKVYPNGYIALFNEANGAWYGHYAGWDPAGFRAAARRMAWIIRQEAPGIKIGLAFSPLPPNTNSGGQAWNPNASNNIADYWPGDDAIDFIDIHLYDNKNRESYSNPNYSASWSLGAWINFAKAHKKYLAVGEWGVQPTAAQLLAAGRPIAEILKAKGNGDNVAYMNEIYTHIFTKYPVMYSLYFDTNTEGLYLNSCLSCTGGTWFPNARARFVELWR